MYNQYPYLNLNDFNLDYILKAIKEMRYEVTNFVSINAIKYADPIQWNITSQYEKNTIVIDPVTGTAYISVAPVPAGVALTRPEYWTVVFDLQSFVTKANQNLANNYEEQTTTTATMNTNAGAWVIWGDVLYKALVNITAGDAYVVGSNIERITIEDVIKAIVQEIANEVQARQDADTAINNTIGDLNDLTTTDKTSVVNAINDEVQARQDNIDAEVQAINNTIGDLNNLATADKSSVVNAINELDSVITGLNTIYYNVEDYGAVGDGITDDTAAIQAAIAAAEVNGGIVFLPHKTKYRTTQTLVMTGKSYLLGEGMSEIASSANPVLKCNGWYGGIDNILFSGDGTNNAILFDTLHVNAEIPFIWRLQHLEISNFVQAIYDNSDSDQSHYVVDFLVYDVYIRRNFGDSIDIKRSRGFMTFRNVKVDNTYNIGTYTPYVAFKFNDVVGLELEMCDVVASGATNQSHVYQPNQCAYQIIGTTNGKASIWLKRCVFDSGLGRGFYIENIDMVQMFECECYGTFGVCMQLNNLNYLLIADSIIKGAKGDVAAPNDVRGIVLQSVNKAVISNSEIWDIVGYGIMYYQSTDICNTNAYIDNCDVGIWSDSGDILNSNAIIKNCATARTVNTECHFVNSYIEGVYELNS